MFDKKGKFVSLLCLCINVLSKFHMSDVSLSYWLDESERPQYLKSG